MVNPTIKEMKGKLLIIMMTMMMIMIITVVVMVRRQASKITTKKLESIFGRPLYSKETIF